MENRSDKLYGYQIRMFYLKCLDPEWIKQQTVNVKKTTFVATF